jgi:hypothetical protein
MLCSRKKNIPRLELAANDGEICSDGGGGV